MDIKRAKELLSKLAEGIDPITGEVLPDDHICNNAEIIRALYTLLNATEAVRNKPENAGKPWTAEDDKELERLYGEGVKISELKGRFKRSRTSIEARLDKLGLGGKPWTPRFY